MESSRPTGIAPPHRTPNGRGAAIDLVILNAVALAMVATFLNGSIGEWGGDNLQFELLARALASGDGYVDLHRVGIPPHVRYPPLFPAMLAPLVAAGLPRIALKGFVALLSVAGLNVAYRLLAGTRGRAVALLATLCTACAGPFLDPALSVMSDGPFFLASILALDRVERLFRERDAGPLAAVTCGALVGAAILTRAIGVVLLPAVAMHALTAGSSVVPFRRRVTRLAIVGSVAVAVAGPWFVWAEASGEQTYVREFRVKAKAGAPPGLAAVRESSERERPGLVARVVARPLQNLDDLRVRLAAAATPRAVRALGETATTAFSTAFVIACAALAAATFLGLVRAVVLRRRVADWYVLGYLALLLVWVGGGSRMVMPVLVFLFVFAGEGAGAVAGAVARRFGRDGAVPGRRTAIALLAILAVGNVVVTYTFPALHDRLAGRYGAWWDDYVATAQRLGRVAAPGEVVLSLPDTVPYYVAGLQAPGIDRARRSHEGTLGNVLASGATYVVDTPFLRVYAPTVWAVVEEHPEHFVEIGRRGRVRVYRIVRDPEGGDAGGPLPDPAGDSPPDSSR